jgi:hypothetical protein
VIVRVSVQWPHAVRFQAGDRVSGKCAVAQALKASGASNPYVSFAVLKGVPSQQPRPQQCLWLVKKRRWH